MSDFVKLPQDLAIAVSKELKRLGFDYGPMDIMYGKGVEIEHLSKITRLSFENPSAGSLRNIEQLPNLQELYITNDLNYAYTSPAGSISITDEDIEHIEKCKKLRRLEIINQTDITGINLSNLTELEDLTINRCENLLSIEDIDQIKKLDSLTCYGNNSLNDFDGLDKMIASGRIEPHNMKLDVQLYPKAIGYNAFKGTHNATAVEMMKGPTNTYSLSPTWIETNHVRGDGTVEIRHGAMLQLHKKACDIVDRHIPKHSDKQEIIYATEKYLAENVVYDHASSDKGAKYLSHDGIRYGPKSGAQGAYNCLVNNCCVCQGYSRGEKYLLALRGIKASEVDCLGGQKDEKFFSDPKKKWLHGQNPSYDLDGFHSIVRFDDYFGLYSDPCWNAGRWQKGDKTMPYTLKTKSDISKIHTLSFFERNWMGEGQYINPSDRKRLRETNYTEKRKKEIEIEKKRMLLQQKGNTTSLQTSIKSDNPTLNPRASLTEQPTSTLHQTPTAEQPTPTLRQTPTAEQPTPTHHQTLAPEQPTPPLRQTPTAEQPTPTIHQTPAQGAPQSIKTNSVLLKKTAKTLSKVNAAGSKLAPAFILLSCALDPDGNREFVDDITHLRGGKIASDMWEATKQIALHPIDTSSAMIELAGNAVHERYKNAKTSGDYIMESLNATKDGFFNIGDVEWSAVSSLNTAHRERMNYLLEQAGFDTRFDTDNISFQTYKKDPIKFISNIVMPTFVDSKTKVRSDDDLISIINRDDSIALKAYIEEKNADINQDVRGVHHGIDIPYNTALQYAISQGHIKTAQVLYDQPNVNYEGLNQETGDTTLMTLMRHIAPDIEEEEYKTGKPNLSQLPQEKKEEYLMTQSMIDDMISNKKVDLNIENFEGQNAFLVAAECGNLQAVNLFLEQGANINQTDNNKNNALHHCHHNQLMVATLIEQGINANYANERGDTPLMMALEGHGGQNMQSIALLMANTTEEGIQHLKTSPFHLRKLDTLMQKHPNACHLALQLEDHPLQGFFKERYPQALQQVTQSLAKQEPVISTNSDETKPEIQPVLSLKDETPALSEDQNQSTQSKKEETTLLENDQTMQTLEVSQPNEGKNPEEPALLETAQTTQPLEVSQPNEDKNPEETTLLENAQTTQPLEVSQQNEDKNPEEPTLYHGSYSHLEVTIPTEQQGEKSKRTPIDTQEESYSEETTSSSIGETKTPETSNKILKNEASLIRVYQNKAYQHASLRLSQQIGKQVSGIKLSADTIHQAVQNVQDSLSSLPYTSQQLHQQAQMIVYKIIMANKLYHPDEKIGNTNQTLTDLIGRNHREILREITQQMTEAEKAELLPVLQNIEDTIAQKGHAIIDVEAKGMSYDTSKTAGYKNENALIPQKKGLVNILSKTATNCSDNPQENTPLTKDNEME